jgi:SH3 domain-containing protein
VRGRPDSEQFGGALRRPNRSGMLGQEQSVSYQAEERYWTDYLRIALPIAGLLLLLGVFWYWASSYIGDDNDNDPQTPVAQVVNTPITANTPTPTAGSAVELNPVTAAPTQETQAAEPTDEPDTQPTPTTEEATDPGEEPSGDGTFAEGDLVTVNDNDVNLRAEASTDAEIVATLINGEELTVLSGEPIDDGTYVWWNVENLDGLQGWVAGDFIEASS